MNRDYGLHQQGSGLFYFNRAKVRGGENTEVPKICKFEASDAAMPINLVVVNTRTQQLVAGRNDSSRRAPARAQQTRLCCHRVVVVLN